MDTNMKVGFSEAVRIDRDTMTIFNYPQKSKAVSVVRIKVHGRHPQQAKTQFIEHDCHVIFYVINGHGKVVVEDVSYDLSAEDTITILPGQRYYVEGEIDYLAIVSPSYYKEQNEVVST